MFDSRHDRADGGPRLQSGALAYRRGEDGDILVLLVSKRRSRQWGIPKGNVAAALSLQENAAKEAFEEAGVKGIVAPRAAGMFRATKRTPGPGRGPLIIEVWVYLLEVTQCLRRWPEMRKRHVKWVSWTEAAAALREPILAELCRGLGARDIVHAKLAV